MIRPYTIFCVLLAGASGLFLYSKKHETNVLDQNIRAIVRQTDDTRQQTAMLQSQWALLNQPDRLQALSSRFLARLSPMSPEQYRKLGSAVASLPAPGVSMPHQNVMLADASQSAPSKAPILLAKNEALVASHAIDDKASVSSEVAHHVVSDKPRPRAAVMFARSSVMRSAEPVQRARADSHVHYATYHGRRAVATPAMAWREVSARDNPSSVRGHETRFSGRINASESHDTQSAFALADGALPPPAPRGD